MPHLQADRWKRMSMSRKIRFTCWKARLDNLNCAIVTSRVPVSPGLRANQSRRFSNPFQVGIPQRSTHNLNRKLTWFNLGHSSAARWNVHTKTLIVEVETQRAPVFQSPFECHGQDPRITRNPINPFSRREGRSSLPELGLKANDSKWEWEGVRKRDIIRTQNGKITTKLLAHTLRQP